MAQHAGIQDNIRSSARTGDWADRLGRVGLAARGVVYLLLGVLAFRVAWGDRSESADKGGALKLLAEQPLGGALLAILAAGLISYAAWLLVEAVVYRDEKDHKEWAKRIGYLGRAALYATVFVAAIGVIRQEPSSPGASGERGLTASVLAWGGPGQLLVGIVGLAFIAAGVWNAYRGVTTKFEDHLKTGEMDATQQRVVKVLGVAGLLGRAVAFGAIGWFVVDAALAADPNQPLGLDESLAELAQGPLGPVGLSAVALGLFLYGVYSFAEARWKDLSS